MGVVVFTVITVVFTVGLIVFTVGVIVFTVGAVILTVRPTDFIVEFHNCLLGLCILAIPQIISGWTQTCDSAHT